MRLASMLFALTVMASAACAQQGDDPFGEDPASPLAPVDIDDPLAPPFLAVVNPDDLAGRTPEEWVEWAVREAPGTDARALFRTPHGIATARFPSSPARATRTAGATTSADEKAAREILAAVPVEVREALGRGEIVNVTSVGRVIEEALGEERAAGALAPCPPGLRPRSFGEAPLVMVQLGLQPVVRISRTGMSHMREACLTLTWPSQTCVPWAIQERPGTNLCWSNLEGWCAANPESARWFGVLEVTRRGGVGDDHSGEVLSRLGASGAEFRLDNLNGVTVAKLLAALSGDLDRPLRCDAGFGRWSVVARGNKVGADAVLEALLASAPGHVTLEAVAAAVPRRTPGSIAVSEARALVAEAVDVPLNAVSAEADERSVRTRSPRGDDSVRGLVERLGVPWDWIWALRPDLGYHVAEGQPPAPTDAPARTHSVEPVATDGSDPTAELWRAAYGRPVVDKLPLPADRFASRYSSLLEDLPDEEAETLRALLREAVANNLPSAVVPGIAPESLREIPDSARVAYDMQHILVVGVGVPWHDIAQLDDGSLSVEPCDPPPVLFETCGARRDAPVLRCLGYASVLY